jgi:hypothetical protein
MAFEGLALNLRPFNSIDFTYAYDQHFFWIFYLFTPLRLHFKKYHNIPSSADLAMRNFG